VKSRRFFGLTINEVTAVVLALVFWTIAIALILP
jgi:hypothetical protein